MKADPTTQAKLLQLAEVDTELERSRELLAGIKAERDLQLPLRDDTKVVKDEAKEQEDIEQGAALRRSAGRSKDPDDT